MSNLTFEILASLVLLAHVAVLALALKYRGATLAILLNLFLACAVVGYWLDQLGRLLQSEDYPVMALLGFEMATAATSIFALRKARISPFLIWLEFSIHFLFAAAMTLFAFTFEITRLI